MALKAVGPLARGARGRLLAALKDAAHRSPANLNPMAPFFVVVPSANALAAIAPRDPEVVSTLLEIMARGSSTNQLLAWQTAHAAALLAAIAPQDPYVVSGRQSLASIAGNAPVGSGSEVVRPHRRQQRRQSH